MKKVKTLFRLTVLGLLVGGWSLGASALHVVWNGDKLAVVTKDRLAVRDTYADVSHWTADDVAAHPALAKRLIATERAYLLAKSFNSAGGTELVAQIQEAIARGPTTQPTPTVNDKVADTFDRATTQADQLADKAKQALDHAKGAIQ